MDEDGRLIRMPETEGIELETNEKEKVEETPQETETHLEEATIIQPKEEPFEPHLYDCPMCHKKVKIHFDGCGCSRNTDVYSYVMKMFK